VSSGEWVMVGVAVFARSRQCSPQCELHAVPRKSYLQQISICKLIRKNFLDR
jgi:hypothetical protein